MSRAVEVETAALTVPSEGPAHSLRVTGEWFCEIAARLEAGGDPADYDALWPLLLAEAKVAETLRRLVPKEALAAAERRFWQREGASGRLRRGWRAAAISR